MYLVNWKILDPEILYQKFLYLFVQERRFLIWNKNELDLSFKTFLWIHWEALLFYRNTLTFQFETSRYEGTSILQIFVIYPLCISIVASRQTKLWDESATALTKICRYVWWCGHRHKGRWEGRKALPAGNPVKLWDFTPRSPNLSLLRRPQRIIIDPIAHFGKEW